MFKPTKEESKAPFIPLFSLDLNFLLAAAPGGGTDAKNTQKSKLGRQLSLGCEQTTTASSEWAQVGALLVEAQTFPRGTGGKPPPLNFHSPHFPASLAHTLPPAPPPPISGRPPANSLTVARPAAERGDSRAVPIIHTRGSPPPASVQTPGRQGVLPPTLLRGPIRPHNSKWELGT